jgi:YebC/PmpR family DNA-binding regulatory protein
MSREIIVAAKMGGGDPAANFRLRTAIERAKAGGVPNDNIARAIEKGSGAGSSENYEELVYEGYGPGGVALLVKCTTDNRNRTAGDVRLYFSKNGGNMGESGCVNWMFKERGEIYINKDAKFDEEVLLGVVLDAGAEDLDVSDPEQALIVCPSDKVENVRQALIEAKYKVQSADTTMAPSNTIEVTDQDTAKSLLKLIDALENHDDVESVHANFEMDQDWLAEFLG